MLLNLKNVCFGKVISPTSLDKIFLVYIKKAYLFTHTKYSLKESLPFFVQCTKKGLNDKNSNHICR